MTGHILAGPLFAAMLVSCTVAASDTSAAWEDESDGPTTTSETFAPTSSTSTSASTSSASWTSESSVTSASTTIGITTSSTSSSTTTAPTTSSGTTAGTSGNLELCGDGIVDPWEECDEGRANSNEGACLSICKNAACGDGFIHADVEECDDGNLNNDDDCVKDCEIAFCGDGLIKKGVEECDDANTNSDDACVGECKKAACGDGFIQADIEECDDANMLSGDDCSDACSTVSQRIIFVTSIPFFGDLTTDAPGYEPPMGELKSLALADAHCNQLATSASIPGTFTAWLSSNALSAKVRLGLTEYTGDFVRLDDEIVASSWSDLVDGTINKSINRDEYGATIKAPNTVWTGTADDGEAFGTNCSAWMSKISTARCGNATKIDAAWTDGLAAGSCAYKRRLYCIQTDTD